MSLDKERVTTRLDKTSIASLNELARLNNSFFQLQLQRILDKYLEKELEEAYRECFESAFNTQEHPIEDDPDSPF